MRCGRPFTPDVGFEYQKVCSPCWKLKVDAEPKRKLVKPVDGVEARAVLLKRCWDLTSYAKDEGAREALAVTLFLSELRGS